MQHQCEKRSGVCVCVCVCDAQIFQRVLKLRARVCALYCLRGQGPIKVLDAVRWVKRGGYVLFTREIHVQLWRGMHIRADMRVGIMCAMVPPLLLNQNPSKKTGLGVLSAGSPMALRKQGARLQVWVLLRVKGPWRRGGRGEQAAVAAVVLVLAVYRVCAESGILRFFRGPSALAHRLQGNCLAEVTTLWWPREVQCLIGAGWRVVPCAKVGQW